MKRSLLRGISSPERHAQLLDVLRTSVTLTEAGRRLSRRDDYLELDCDTPTLRNAWEACRDRGIDMRRGKTVARHRATRERNAVMRAGVLTTRRFAEELGRAEARP